MPGSSAQQQRLIRVFVSSTFRDMIEDRNELMTQVGMLERMKDEFPKKDITESPHLNPLPQGERKLKVQRAEKLSVTKTHSAARPQPNPKSEYRNPKEIRNPNKQTLRQHKKSKDSRNLLFVRSRAFSWLSFRLAAHQ